MNLFIPCFHKQGNSWKTAGLVVLDKWFKGLSLAYIAALVVLQGWFQGASLYHSCTGRTGWMVEGPLYAQKLHKLDLSGDVGEGGGRRASLASISVTACTHGLMQLEYSFTLSQALPLLAAYIHFKSSDCLQRSPLQA